MAPIVLLLTHCHFAAEIRQLPQVPGLRALFVRYPPKPGTATTRPTGCTSGPRPAFAHRCERWECLESGAIGQIAAAIGRLIA